jgi:hypothetical protein
MGDAPIFFSAHLVFETGYLHLIEIAGARTISGA